MDEGSRLFARDHNHNGAVSGNQSEFGSYDGLVQDLVRGKIQIIRTTHVILEAFSIAAVLLIALRILFDGWRASSLQTQLRPRKFALFHAVHPAEKVALILALALAVQQLVFIAVGSPALDSVMVNGCAVSAQLIWPALFLVPYTILIFGVETAIRSMRKDRFASLGKWTIPICLVAVVLMTFLTWIPSNVTKTTDRCVGSLVWWVYEYATAATAIVSALIFLFIVLAITIGFRLVKSVKLDPSDRIAASRMVYYLAFGVLVQALVLPFYAFASKANFRDEGISARLAPIALSVSGLLFAFWHCFDRANAYKIALRPLQTPWETDRPLRFLGPNDLEARARGVWPPDAPVVMRESSEHLVSQRSTSAAEKDLESGERSGSRDTMREVMRTSPFPLQPSSTPHPDTRDSNQHLPKRSKSSYSIFPTDSHAQAVLSPEMPVLPATIYSRASPPESHFNPIEPMEAIRKESIDRLNERGFSIQTPPSLFSTGHNRQGSSQSTATVQIGLRMSAVPITISPLRHSRQSAVLKKPTPSTLLPISRDMRSSIQPQVVSPDRTLYDGVDMDRVDDDETRFSILTFANNLFGHKQGREKSLPPLPRSPSRAQTSASPFNPARGPRSPPPVSPRRGGWGLAMHPPSPEMEAAQASPTLGYNPVVRRGSGWSE